ncbi:sugar transferase [Parasphingorhabdus sp.]
MLKRLFDIVLAATGLLATSWLIAICWLVAAIETGSNGFFVQPRVGRHGKLFNIIKIKTMRNLGSAERSSVSVKGMSEITRSGAFFRKFKLDELPQLWNVLLGQMSFVGPRPDVEGFADQLEGKDRLILELRPGITGPASLSFRNEEELLATVDNPEEYNVAVIWPEKVRINLEYYYSHNLLKDLGYLFRTIWS